MAGKRKANAAEARLLYAEAQAKVERAERDERVAKGEATILPMLGARRPTRDILFAVILEMAEEAYKTQIVDAEMQDVIEESREEWLESYIGGMIEPYLEDQAHRVADPPRGYVHAVGETVVLDSPYGYKSEGSYRINNGTFGLVQGVDGFRYQVTFDGCPVTAMVPQHWLSRP